MKKTSLLLAGALALVPYSSYTQEEPVKITSFLEGLCIGIGVGLVGDTLIIIGIECYKRKHSTNAPPVLPWAPFTNSPPLTNRISSVLRSGSNVVEYANGAFQTVLQTSDSISNFYPLYTITGFPLSNNNWRILVQDTNGVGVVTNDGPWLQSISIPMMTNNPKQFYMLSTP